MAKVAVPDQVECKFCKAQLAPQTSVFGHVMQCPGCQQRFIRAPGEAIHQETMFACPMCRTGVVGGIQVVGSMIACPECGGQFPGPPLVPPAPKEDKGGH